MGVSAREQSEERFPVVHMHRGSAIRRPLIVLAVCAVAAVGYVARDFLIPTAGAIVLALILTPVANTFDRLRLPPSLSAAASVFLLAMGLAALLAISIPALTNWIDQTPYLTYTLERKLEGVRKSIAIVQEVSKQVEQAASAATPTAPATTPPEKVVVREKSLMAELASTRAGPDAAGVLCRGAGLPAARPSQQLAAADHAHPGLVQHTGAVGQGHARHQ